MDLTQLANLGEFIGDVAVLVTLIYLATQVRQASALAKAESSQKKFTNYSSWRQMLTNEGINTLWLKSSNGEDLSPQEEQRLYVVFRELTFAAVAMINNHLATGNQAFVKHQALVVAREIRSQTMRGIWSRVADDLTSFGFADLATAVTDLLDAKVAHS